MGYKLRATLWFLAALLMVGVSSDAETTELRPIRVFPEALPSWWAESDTVVIDVRPRADYRAGHIPGAIHRGHWNSASGIDLVTERLGQMGIRGEETFVLYGDGDSYDAVSDLFWWLERAGCRKVWILEGGIRSWQQSGKDLEKKPRTRPSVEFSGVPSEEPLASLQWVRRHFGTEGVEIIDARESSGGALYRFPPSFQKGHIPHSLPYDFSGLHEKDGVWLADRESARNEFERLGPRPEDPVRLDSVFTLYGANSEDSRPMVGYLILRMLGVRAKLYLGGWAEWSRHPSPVVKILGTEELHDWLERDVPGMILFDSRIRRDYDIGHIPGALSFPAYEADDRFKRLLQGEDAPEKDHPLVFYCYGVDCIRSRNYSTQAARMGFRKVYWFREGYPGWTEAGFEVIQNLTAVER